MAPHDPTRREAPARPKFIQSALQVKRKERLTPHYMRVVLTGEDVPRFADATVGENNKIFIPPAGATSVAFPRVENGKRIFPGDGERPVVRTFTHRGLDLDANEMWIDFVLHGDGGIASAWALNALPGDVLGVTMKAGKSELVPVADEYVLVGDAAAIPVLGSILETLPTSARVTAVLEVHGPEDEQPLATNAQATIRWLHNPEPVRGSGLSQAVRDLALPARGARRFAYVAAELRAVRAIRTHLRVEAGWERDELYAYSYWKAHAPEDVSETERRQERDSARG